MNLTNEDYNEILAQYDEKQLELDHLLKERRQELYEKIPEYKELDEEITSLYAMRARLLIRGDEAAILPVSEKIEDLERKQKLLLTEAGYSINYLVPQYSCPICRDTGLVEGARCRCFKQALTKRLYEKSNIKNVLEKKNFSTLRHDLQIGEDLRLFEKAYAKSVQFVEEFGTTYRNLCFSGTVGTGKSFLSNCILNELLKQNYSCIYYTAPTLFDTIANYKFRHVQGIMNPTDLLYTCDLLVIDDLGTEMTNNFTISEFLTLLNQRNLAAKSTVISTNLSLENLNDTYSDRVFSRLFANFEICILSGQDIRSYLKQMQNRK